MRFFSWFSILSILLTLTFQARANGFGINATRLIYPEGAESISVTVRNTLPNIPYLVQANVSKLQDSQTASPFVVTPPIFRLEPQSINQLRITFTGIPLPQDRESIFYFHATAIPSSAALDNSQQDLGVAGNVRFGVGNIIKLFYRPTNLPGSSATAQKGLQFTRMQGELKATNPTPYFVSLAGLNAGGHRLALDTPEALMLAPYGSHVWRIKNLPIDSQISWQTINDTGGIDEFSTILP